MLTGLVAVAVSGDRLLPAETQKQRGMLQQGTTGIITKGDN